eukprot:SAG11_NODE_13584_length_648_cov_2.896175_1_plen_134_part_01
MLKRLYEAPRVDDDVLVCGLEPFTALRPPGIPPAREVRPAASRRPACPPPPPAPLRELRGGHCPRAPPLLPAPAPAPAPALARRRQVVSQLCVVRSLPGTWDAAFTNGVMVKLRHCCGSTRGAPPPPRPPPVAA